MIPQKKIDRREAEDREKYSYENVSTYYVWGDEFKLENSSLNKFEECDVVISDIDLFVGNSELPRLCDVVVYGGELIYPVISGRYPNLSDLEGGIPCVVLGKRIKKDTYSRDEKDYIRINGDEYYVTGYISAKSSAVLDYKVILYYENIGNSAREDVDYYKRYAGIMLSFFSREDLSKYAGLFDDYKKTYPENFYEVEYNPFPFSDAVSESSRKIAMVVYIFSVALVALVFIYWYLSNRKEFAIRKAYGYRTADIIFLILKKILLLFLMAFFFSELIMAAVNWLDSEPVIFNPQDMLERILSVLRYLALTIPLIMAFPIAGICMSKPDALLRKKE